MPPETLTAHLSSPRKGRCNLAKEHMFRCCAHTKRRRVCGSYITEDIIITQILTRLPVISLLRFKSVCKSWYALITDPTFVAAHLAHSKNNPKVVIIPQRLMPILEVNLYSYDPEQGAKHANFLLGRKFQTKVGILRHPHHSNGLMLLNTGQCLLVCNPSTREVITLPECSPNHLKFSYEDRAGLGYIQSSNVYKVAQYFYRSFDFTSQTCSLGFEVITLGADSGWRAVAEDPPYPVDIRRQPVSIGGTMYFKIDERLHTSAPRSILSFDLKDEKFESVRGPDCLTGGLKIVRLLELEGKLCFLAKGLENKKYDLWMCEDYRSHTWVHICTINFPRVPRFFSVIAVRNRKLLLHIDGGNYHRLACYHPRDKYFTTLVSIAGDFAYRKGSKCPSRYYHVDASIRVIRYTESMQTVTPRRTK